MRKFYIDVDDTLADFKSHAVACGVPPWTGTWYATDPATWTDEQHAIQRRTNELMEDANFWMGIPLMPGALELVAACATRGETYLLTAFPKTCPDKGMVERVKHAWAEFNLHFPKHRVLVVERQDEIKHATWRSEVAVDDWRDYSNVLIDDAAKNCDEWTAAGGVAILSDFHNGVSLKSVIANIKSL